MPRGRRQSRASPDASVESVPVSDNGSEGSDGPDFIFSDKESTPTQDDDDMEADVTVRRLTSVEVPPITDKEGYEELEGAHVVSKILREIRHGSEDVRFEVRFGDNHTEIVGMDELFDLENGPSAFEKFDDQSPEPSGDELQSEDSDMLVQPRASSRRTSNRQPGFVDITNIDLSSDEGGDPFDSRPSRRAGARASRNTTRSRSVRFSEPSLDDDFEVEEEDQPRRSSRRTTRNNTSKSARIGRTGPATRQSGRLRGMARSHDSNETSNEDESGSDDGLTILESDVLPKSRKRKRHGSALQSNLIAHAGTRRSDRSNRHQRNMQEREVDDIYRSDTDAPKAAPKAVGAREVFKELPRTDEFRQRHIQVCETCGYSATIGPLIYCQGCILAYHKHCIGQRTTREHLVTKIEQEDFVLQCRRCVNAAQRKESTAPNMAICQVCRETNLACVPFRERKSAAQEQKDREDNDGDDPISFVNPRLINNVNNILFRCTKCWRGFHFHHLPPLSTHHMDIEREDEEAAQERFLEYSKDWFCTDCHKAKKVSGIIAWRPTDIDAYSPSFTCEMMDEDDKQYLIKWENQSYFRAQWMPGAWVWGVTAHAMRKAFNKREEGPKMRTEDAIPEEYLRIDIVLDVKYTSIVDIRTEEIDKARIKEVDEALIKYKGLGYEEAVWEKVPTPEDGERWTDFVTAYNDWVLGRYTHTPKGGPLRARLEKVRAQPFTKLEKTKQPEQLVGGELMKYQMDGLNWLYYRWFSKKNGILADEMGLGKTIQVISFLTALVHDHNCFPFLVVVPNSTCANWRREIKQWAPSLRVVTHFGSTVARDMAYKYEMFPGGSKDLRCHVVVTSYDAAADESCRKFFKSVPWQGLIVDEGQRLKSDKSILYSALNSFKIPFKVLLTGTPLQNNARELFNLLQFLDDELDAEALEQEYAEMTSENISRLHDLIRPYILRRTKAQVLTFLPPMAQIILPISMSVLQKKLYKSILSKNPDLLRSLFSQNKSLKPSEKGSLNNILMQLRKCLCHPFVYSKEIEERTDVAAISHRNLVEASAKLQLLELLLPKLQERGHRVLLFSQFLDMLDICEDFLEGMAMRYQRLDGSMSSLEKQKRIDEFNAPNSPLFAFLLSTRAGGVGINLATADTVIILDPDFNPHQDIQALSRAHRIGQKKKVLCFQLMTRASAEEKIVQIGRKKMALDHVVVEQLDNEDLEEKDLESVLKHGAKELFDDDDDHDIKYDNASIEKLLDRSQIENTEAGTDNSAESQFSFARVWANDQGALEGNLDLPEEEEAPDPDAWEKILKERERAAAAEAAARQQMLGRGKRARMVVDYAGAGERAVMAEVTGNDDAASPAKSSRRRRKDTEDSDTDFQAEPSDGEDESDKEMATAEPEAPGILDQPAKSSAAPTGGILGSSQRASNASPFQRVRVPHIPADSLMRLPPHMVSRTCPACSTPHPIGACPLKLAGVEHCGLCGLAHYGHGRVCPHIGSETQVREMLEALKSSPEQGYLVEAAKKYLRGVKGHLVQAKKKAREKQQMMAMGTMVAPMPGTNGMPSGFAQQPNAGGMYGGGSGSAGVGMSMAAGMQGAQALAQAGMRQAMGALQGGFQPGQPSGSATEPINLDGASDPDGAVASALLGYLGNRG